MLVYLRAKPQEKSRATCRAFAAGFLLFTESFALSRFLTAQMHSRRFFTYRGRVFFLNSFHVKSCCQYDLAAVSVFQLDGHFIQLKCQVDNLWTTSENPGICNGFDEMKSG